METINEIVKNHKWNKKFYGNKQKGYYIFVNGQRIDVTVEQVNSYLREKKEKDEKIKYYHNYKIGRFITVDLFQFTPSYKEILEDVEKLAKEIKVKTLILGKVWYDEKDLKPDCPKFVLSEIIELTLPNGGVRYYEYEENKTYLYERQIQLSPENLNMFLEKLKTLKTEPLE